MPETPLTGLLRAKWDERLSAGKVQAAAWLNPLGTASKVLDPSVTKRQFLLLVMLTHGLSRSSSVCPGAVLGPGLGGLHSFRGNPPTATSPPGRER